jgi:uncharacterized protein YcfJ
MVKTITTVAIFGLLGANVALADHGYERGYGYGHRGPDFAYGRVISVEPIVSYVTVNQPRQECRDEYVRQQTGVAGPTAAGAVIGAAIGRQFGGGSGRDLATLAGALAGGAIANQRAQRNQDYREVPVERCRVVNDRVQERVVDGYDVTYVYQGRRYVTRTAEPPGDRIPLTVEVRPAGYSTWR